MLRGPSTPLVGLVGFPGTGKDAIAKVLVEDYGWLRVAFADALKADLCEIDPDIHSVEHLDTCKRNDTYWRVRLQLHGEYVRKIDYDYWVNKACKAERAAFVTTGLPYAGVVYTDVRYENEAEMICERGGFMVGVHRTGYDMVNDHISERNTQDILNGCFHTVSNNGTPEEAAEALLRGIQEG